QLAEHIENQRGKLTARLLPPLEPVGDDRPVPLSYTQKRVWYLQQLDPQTTSYNIPIAWRIDGDLDADCLQRVVDEIVSRHEVLRTQFVMTDEEPVQVVDPGIWVKLVLENARDIGEARELLERTA